MKTAQRKRLIYGDDKRCRSCGAKGRIEVIEVPEIGTVKVVTCPYCDGRGEAA